MYCHDHWNPEYITHDKVIVCSKGDKRLLIDELSLSFSIIGSKTYSLTVSIGWILWYVSTGRTGFYLICATPVQCLKEELDRQPLPTYLRCLSVRERKHVVLLEIWCSIVDKQWNSMDEFNLIDWQLKLHKIIHCKRGQWIIEPPVLKSILYVISWKF